MKKNAERTFFHRLLFACLLLLLLFVGIACEKDAEGNELSNTIIGTWHQTSRTTDDLPAAKDSSRLLLQINDDRICILCDSSAVAVKSKTIIKRSGWSLQGGILNIALDLPVSWKPSADSNTLTLERMDFKQDGTLSKTKLTYIRVPNMEIK